MHATLSDDKQRVHATDISASEAAELHAALRYALGDDRGAVANPGVHDFMCTLADLARQAAFAGEHETRSLANIGGEAVSLVHAASVLDVSEQHARRLIADKKLRAHKLGRQWLVEASSLAELLAQRLEQQ